MHDASLPSLPPGSTCQHLRRMSAKAISDIKRLAPLYPAGACPAAATLQAFFAACADAAGQYAAALPANINKDLE
jgi:hypothetical protein